MSPGRQDREDSLTVVGEGNALSRSLLYEKGVVDFRVFIDGPNPFESAVSEAGDYFA
jgi:hypothetical protein